MWIERGDQMAMMQTGTMAAEMLTSVKWRIGGKSRRIVEKSGTKMRGP